MKIPVEELLRRWQALTGEQPPDSVPETSWLLLPAWLNAAWRDAAVPLADVLWGQYAVFSFVRIQDDLLDGQEQRLDAQFLADQFLIDSLETYQEMPALGQDFWRDYRRRLRDTVTGILEVRALECEPGAFTAEHLDLHARVGAIFGIGVTALCHLCGRTAELSWLNALQTQTAVFSQINDDLQDLQEDLIAQRFTWVANVLGADRTGAGTFEPARMGIIAAQLSRRADAALAAVPPHAPETVRAYAAGLVRQAELVEGKMQVLAELLGP